MSMCKTGCGKEALDGWELCNDCCLAWAKSPEYRRSEEQDRLRLGGPRVDDRALFDFCTRVRAERQNGKPL